jgi:aminomethyltransferase
MTSKNKQTQQTKKGPASADLLQALTSYDLRALTFGRSAFVPLEGINVHVARGGYTGEDGFEVSLSPTAF